jgi:hypothetical protein
MTNGIGRVGWRSFVSAAPTNNNPLWNNLVAYYTADSTVNDSKGTANGTLINGATYSTGKINNGFSFDGINDYVNFGNNLDFNGSTPFSFSAWVKPTTLSGLNCILSKMVAATAQGYYLRLENGIRFVIYNADTSGVVVTTTTSIPLNVYTHITVTYSGNGLGNGFNIYVNGVNTTLTIVRNAFYGSASNSASFSIGSQYTGASANVFFNGVIDEVGAWSRVLTTSEVTELYNAGAGKQYVAPTPAYTTRTAAFATATGITDTTILNALNTFDTGLISNGLATKMKALYPFVGGTSATHKFNFMDARDVDAAFRLAFNGGWVHSSTGALPNGTNGYADTYFKPSNSTYTNFGWGFYLTTNSVGVYNEFGFWAPGQVVYGYPNLDGSFYIKYGGNDLDGSGGNTIGFHSYNQSSNQMKRFKNGILTHTFPNVPSNLSLANVSYFIAARNNSGTGGQFSNRSRTFQYISDGLTDSEATTLYTLVQAMQTALSRQV